MVKIKIHRGTNQIGGSITEIYTENTHIFIDFGSELNVDPDESTDDKMIDMINHTKCDAVLFSHYHGDHVGLMQHIPQQDIRGHEIALCMGLEARKVLIRIHNTLAKDGFENSENHKEILKLLKDRTKWTNLDIDDKTGKIWTDENVLEEWRNGYTKEDVLHYMEEVRRARENSDS